jgi:hypothetical protein
MITIGYVYRLLIEPDCFKVGLSNAPDGQRIRSWTPRRLLSGYACNFATLRDVAVPALHGIEPVQALHEADVHNWLVDNGHPRHRSFVIRAKNAVERARDAQLNRPGRPSKEVFLLNSKTWAQVDAMLEKQIRYVISRYEAGTE